MVGLNVKAVGDVISVEIIIFDAGGACSAMKKESYYSGTECIPERNICVQYLRETIIGAVIVHTVRVHGMMGVIVN